MTCPQILDAGNNLFDTGAAVNMLNKQLLTKTAWGLGTGLKTMYQKLSACYEMSQKALDLDRFFGML